ncbi:hypothetical protein AB2B41_13745 [Marimonas sp. MJW-29]|uniref:Heme exporter protein D n=1 Tax=Sulfitobacter sediminis TaxID=3234186 RepID=A0ABV3RNY5_9RHOB
MTGPFLTGAEMPCYRHRDTAQGGTMFFEYSVATAAIAFALFSIFGGFRRFPRKESQRAEAREDRNRLAK